MLTEGLELASLMHVCWSIAEACTSICLACDSAAVCHIHHVQSSLAVTVSARLACVPLLHCQ